MHEKHIVDRLLEKVLGQMPVVDLTCKTDQEMIDIIVKAGQTVEKWKEARKNFNTRTHRIEEKSDWKPNDQFRMKKNIKPRKDFKERKFVDRQQG